MKNHKILFTSACWLLTCFFLVACDKNVFNVQSAASATKMGPSKSGVNQEQLLEVLQSKDFDRAILAMNEIKSLRYSGGLLPLLQDIWNNADIPGVDKTFSQHPRIKLEVADILLQMHKNGTQGLDSKNYAEYARGKLSSTDTDIARQAILVLGVADEAADIPIFVNIITGKESTHFRAAAVALSQSCWATDVMINKLSSSLSEPWRKKFLLETWNNLKGIRNCNK